MSINLAVQTTNLAKTFAGRDVVRSCNMHVQEGKIYGFLGANGAGKTTVFKLLSGLLNPTMGEIVLFGTDAGKNRKQLVKDIGTLIETPIFYEHLSAKNNLEIHLAYMGFKNADIERTLATVGLQGTEHKPVSAFSLGMRQRLAIGRAIIHQPKLLILDEPINGLDPQGIVEMRELFRRLAHEQNITLLISSHILSEIELIADTIGVIVNGELVKEVEMEEVKLRPKGLEAYFMEIMNGGSYCA